MFLSPSDLLRWCLRNTESGSDEFSYDICFPKYKDQASYEGYLWENYDRRLQELVKGISHGTRILEVGCGFGHDLVWAATQGAIGVGIDVKSEFIEISQLTKTKIEAYISKKLDVTLIRKNLISLDDGYKFDLIYMKDVFHHLEPREKVLEKLVELLAPNGKLIIVEPNALNPLIQWQMYRIRGFKTIVEKTDLTTGERYLFGNERLVTGGNILRLFQRFGLKGSITHMRLLPTQLITNNSLLKVARGLERLGMERVYPACIHTIFVGHKVV